MMLLAEEGLELCTRWLVSLKPAQLYYATAHLNSLFYAAKQKALYISDTRFLQCKHPSSTEDNQFM